MLEFKKEIEKLDELKCCVCNRNIQNVNCFTVYDEKKGDVVCSMCCILACLYSNDMLSEKQVNSLPDYVLRYCKEYTKREKK